MSSIDFLFCSFEAKLLRKTEKSLHDLVPIHRSSLTLRKALSLIAYVQWFSDPSVIVLWQTSWLRHKLFFLPKLLLLLFCLLISWSHSCGKSTVVLSIILGVSNIGIMTPFAFLSNLMLVYFIAFSRIVFITILDVNCLGTNFTSH